MTDSTGTTNYSYDSFGRLTTESKGDIIKAYSYDAAGNRKTFSLTNSGTSVMNTAYTYDKRNLLTKVTNGSYTTSYTYDGTGLRQTKTVNGTTTTHIWDGANMVAEANGEYILKRYYRGANGLIYANLAGIETKYLKDGHGNITGLANMSGTTLNKAYCYDAFGVEKDINENDTNPFRYCGEYYDNEIDKIYLRARYYSPIQGRFITEDPIKDGLNWYAYCNGDPVNYCDPSGLKIVVGIAGSDVSSNDNVFYDDLEQYKKDNPNDTVYIFKAWEYKNWGDLKKAIKNKVDGQEIDELVIAAHSTVDSITLSNDYKRPERPNIYIDKGTSWWGIKFSSNADIKIMGCNAGGMAGQKNKKALINYDENGNFKSYTGELVDCTAIAQHIANKTKRTVWAFTNYTSQNSSHRQKAVDRYGEKGKIFSYTTGFWLWKKTENIIGTVNPNYTKFVKE